jgi:hypothetical protein
LQDIIKTKEEKKEAVSIESPVTKNINSNEQQ